VIRLWLAEVRAGGVRRGVRAAIAAVALLTTAFLVAVPRAADSAYDQALTDRLAAAEDGLRDVTLRLKVEPQRGAFGVVPDTVPLQSPEPPFARIDAVARQRLGAAFVDLVDTATHAAQTDPFVLARRQRPLPVEPPQAVVRIQSGLAEHVAWVAGDAPGAPTQTVTIPIPVREGEEPLQRRLDVVPVALAEETAALWGVEVGDRFDLTAANFERGADEDGVVEVVGIFRPTDPGAAFWRADARMLGTAAVESFDGGVISQGALLAAEESYQSLSRSFQPVPERLQAQETTPAFEHTWRYRIDPGGLTAADAQVLRDGVARLRTAPGGWDGDEPTVATGLPSVLDGFAQDVRVTSVLTLFASAGVAALAAFTLMAGALGLLGVRRGEVRLLAARGMSQRQLSRLLAGDLVVWVLPAALLGSAVVLLLVMSSSRGDGGPAVPGRTWLLVAAVATAPVLVALWAARHAVADTGRRATTRSARGRRLVLEAAVVTAAVLLVLQLRGRATTIAAGTADWVAALVPAVTGLAVGLVVLRLLPVLARAVAVVARRSSGATPLVAAAGIRATTAAALPIVALVVGAALVSLLATVATGLTTDRAVAAHQRVGADARIDTLRVDPAGLTTVAESPGVSAVTAAFVGPDTLLVGSAGTHEVELVAGDVPELARARLGTPIALGPALRVADEPVADGGRLAIALSRPVLPDETIELRLRGQRIPARVVAVDPALSRVVDGRVVDVALVDLDSLDAAVKVQPTTVFLTAQDRGGDPLDGVPDLPLELQRESRVGVVAGAADLATSRLVAGTFAGSAAVAVVLLLLAVALLILATRDSRALLGHRSEILGMPRRGQRASEVLGLVPPVLVVTLAGGVLGSALPRLVGAAIDLSPLTGAVADHRVAPRPLAALAVGLAIVVITLAALAVDRALLRRRPLQSTLREGEHP
jgi:putative ABC transport system permease protein